MTTGNKILRLLAGILLTMGVVVVSFSLLPQWMRSWGATEAEVARALPGAELLERGPSDWTHGVTIDAPPEEVWPWIAQIGDERGGFYSYTFIENLMWQTPLLLGLAALFTLTWFTFGQPWMWMRLVVDLGLLILLWAVAGSTRQYNATARLARVATEGAASAAATR